MQGTLKLLVDRLTKYTKYKKADTEGNNANRAQHTLKIHK